MSSQKKMESNRKNSERSTGPKTGRGKNNVRYNALKHGYYAADLIARPEFQEDVARLEKELREQFKPSSALQSIKFKELVYCAWNCELAARADMHQRSAVSSGH